MSGTGDVSELSQAKDSREWNQIRNALEFYGDSRNWREDDWGVVSVLGGHKTGAGYGNPTVKAARALQALRRLERSVGGGRGV